MKMRKFISIVVLAVYSIVMAHSFIPHHHHSEFVEAVQICHHDGHNEHQDHEHNHEHEKSGNCCVNNDHDTDSHQHCSFEEITILVKKINLANLYLPSSDLELSTFKKSIQSYLDRNTPIKISDPHCRDVFLRGPPLFS